ncbi:diacylglycerol kinase [Botrimarina hoheduenensis]|uniref:Undecaprenol kinase n=1 Tax=Botrimarina hoheduenensis TaxID=2528000 RepID=A0A5C5WA10_9BACT|nr:diacylglycerol kinase [Botrimarina hoheduenensis]TWT46462.1 Undecaprenol kinase [Botrimarina hoheduenensis]
MSDQPAPLSLAKRWRNKFACALRGIVIGCFEEDSFAIHLPAAVIVLVYGSSQGVGLIPWLLLVLCVTIVLAAELFNSAIERLAAAITHEVNPLVRDALDIASGAVLVAALGAAAVGALILFS